jgi:hypothetical protein
MITLETLLKQREHLQRRAEEGWAIHHQAKGAMVLIESQIRQLQDEAQAKADAPVPEQPAANGNYAAAADPANSGIQ